MTNLFLASIFFVSPFGNDKNAGTLQSPIRHIQSAIDRATYGDTINVMPGLYREEIYLDGRYWPTNGATGSVTNRLTIKAYGSPITIQSSLLVTNWTPLNDLAEWVAVSAEPFQTNTIFKTQWAVPFGETVQLVMEADDKPLRDVQSLTPHSYLYRCGILYVWSEMTQVTGLEIGGGNSAVEELYGAPFKADGVDYLQFEGIRFRYSATGYGGSGVSVNRFCYFENCAFEYLDWQGLSCWNSTISNCTFRACGAKGLEPAWSNSIVANCVIGGCNWRRFSMAGQAAGIKVITRYYTNPPDCSGTMIVDNLIVTNFADGIWFDSIGAALDRRALIKGNVLSNNIGGIFLEYASGIDVISNQISANSDKGIKLRWSATNLIAFNTVLMDANADIFSAAFHMEAASDPELFKNWSNQVVSNSFVSVHPVVFSTGQDGPTPDAFYFGNVYAWNRFANEAVPLQLNVWEYPYQGSPTSCSTIEKFATLANGSRVQFGWRAQNPNVGNR